MEDNQQNLLTKTAINIKNVFDIVSAIWNYVSIFLFARFAYIYLQDTGDMTISSIVFIICGIYFIISTTVLFLNDQKTATPIYKKIKKAFKIIVKILKLIMILVTIFTITKTSFNPAIIISTLWKIIMICWIVITLALEWIIFRINRNIKRISNTIKNLTQKK